MKKLILALLLLASQASAQSVIANATIANSVLGVSAGGPYSFTYVGSANGSDDASYTTVGTTSGTISVQSGDLIIAAVQWEDNATAEITTGSFDDNNNNNDLTKDSEVHNVSNYINMHIWTGVANTTNATASFDLTIDASVAFKKMVVIVYRPAGGTVTKDITGSPAAVDETNTSTRALTGTFSTASSSDVVCAFAGFYTTGTWSGHLINSVSPDRTQTPNGITGWCRDSVSALTNVTAQVDYSVARYWVTTAIAFKAQ